MEKDIEKYRYKNIEKYRKENIFRDQGKRIQKNIDKKYKKRKHIQTIENIEKEKTFIGLR